MKNQKILILTGALLLAGLVACKPNTSSSEVPPSSSEPTSQAPSSEVEEKEMTVEEAEAIIAEFDKTLTGTVKATYHTDYKLTVDSTNQSMLDRQEDIDLVYTIEADFTEGDLYLHIYVGTGEDAKSLVLVYEATDGYYYVESTSAAPTKLATEELALTKIADSLKKHTKQRASWIDDGTFLYTGAMAYEHSQFLLDSTNIPLEFMDDTRSFEVNEKGGLDITVPLEYVAYNTDSGISELSPKEGSVDKAGGRVSISTDAKGRVVSFTETYEEAELEMPLTTPPPVIHLSGSNQFTAEYGVTLTKKETIPHEATFGIVTFTGVDSQNKGYYDVYTCAYGDWAKMKPLQSGQEAKVGEWICVKPTAAGSNQVAFVSYGTSTEAVVFNGYYCFEILGGNQDLSVQFSGNDVLPTEATITVANNEHVTSSVITWFTMTNVQDQKPTTNGVVTVGNWAGIKLTFEAGYAARSVTVNGVALQNFGGLYCYEVKAGRNVNVVVDAVPVADLNIEKDENVSKATPVTFAVSGTSISEMVSPIKVGNQMKAIVGEWVGIEVECAEGYEVDTVTVNGTPINLMFGYYCYNVKTADAINVQITTKSKAPVVQPTVTITKDSHVSTAAGYTYTLTNNVASERIPLVDNKAIIGQWLGVAVEVEEGYEVDTVTINGKAVNAMFGYYNFNVVDGTAIEVVITTKAKATTPAPAATITVNADAHVTSAPVTYYVTSNPVTQIPATDNKVAVGDVLSIKVTCETGYVVDKVKVGETELSLTYGYYTYAITEATDVTVVITTKAAA